jgi:hypothetical protein
MGVLEDTLNEFKKASPQEKVFVVGGALAAIAIALYIRRQGQTSGGTTASGGAPSTGLQSGGIQTVPGPNASQVPILPPGLNPIFDNQGNLLGYQPIQQNPLNPPAQTTPPAFNPRAPQLPFGTQVPNQIGSLFTYNGTTYTIVPGPGGQIYGAVGKMSSEQAQNTPLGSGKYVLVAPISTYNQYSVKTGGGPYGTRVLSVHGARIAPTRERNQATFVTSLYSSVNRHHR